MSDELWTLNQDAKNIYLEPKNKKGFQADSSNSHGDQTQGSHQSLTLSIAEINNNAEEEKKKCINKYEKLNAK